jgi:putative transposase
MRYRRVSVPGASYFFTVVTHERRHIFAEAQAVRLLYAAIGRVREKRPFAIEAQVILPDHLHAIWTLPDDDCDYPTRWRQIKEAFTRGYASSRPLPARDEAQRARGEQTVWQRRYWEHLIRNDDDFSAHCGVHPFQSRPPRIRDRAARLAALDVPRLGDARPL